MDNKFEEILKLAAELFQRYGLKTISMEDISKHAGISKKTLYKFVKNKEDLIVNVIEHQRRLISKRFQAIPQEGMNAIDILLEHSKIVNDLYENTNPAFRYDIKKYHHHLEDSCLDETNKTIYNTIKRNIELGIEQDLYRNDLDIEMTTLLYAQKIQNVHQEHQGGTLIYTPEQMFKVMMENHIMGLANEKGRAYFIEKKKQLNIE